MPGKPTRSFSARLSVDALQMLTMHSRELGEPMSRVAERFIAEGVQMERFPGVVFRSGPAGRRAALVAGPDVWEVVRDLKAAAGAGASDPVATVAEASGLERGMIELAARYYAARPGDVDQWIARNAEAAEQLLRTLGITVTS